MTTAEFCYYRRAELVKFFKMLYGKNRWRSGVAEVSGIPVMDTYRWLQSTMEGSISLHLRFEIFAYRTGFTSVLDVPVNQYLKKLKSAQKEIDVEVKLKGIKFGEPAIVEEKKL